MLVLIPTVTGAIAINVPIVAVSAVTAITHPSADHHNILLGKVIARSLTITTLAITTVITTIVKPDIPVPPFIMHHRRIRVNTTATLIAIVPAVIGIPAIVISAPPPVPPDARTSFGARPRRGVGVTRGVVVWLPRFPLSGGDDGGGVHDDEAAAQTIPKSVAVTISVIDVPMILPPASSRSSSARAILIDDNGIGVTMDDSSLLPIPAIVMIINVSSGGRGGLSGFPH